VPFVRPVTVYDAAVDPVSVTVGEPPDGVNSTA
jgi:hypothetical protein